MDNRPPKLALTFFHWYCRPDRLEELEGDLNELYAIRASKNPARKWKVDLQFWWDVIRCFKSYSRKSNYLMDTSYALYKSYFKLAWRQMLKNKAPIAINILGMGLALGFCITVYMIYAYNMEFDQFHANTDTVYRIHGMKETENKLERHEATPLAIEPVIATELAPVKEVTSYFTEWATVKKGNQYFDEYIGLASPNFLDFFNFPLQSGSRDALENPNSVYLTQETAKKYFGEVSPLGEDLTIYLNSNKKINVIVAGVFKEIALNSSFQFFLLLNRDAYLSVNELPLGDWSSEKTAGHYIRLTGNGNVDNVNAGINRFISLQNEGQKQWKLDRFELVPFRDDIVANHLIDKDYINARVDPYALMVFNVMAILILFIACFNLANTTIALIAKRVKEIGIRKTLGSFNHQIFIQFLFEMLITMALAFVLAIALTDVIALEIFGLFGVKFLLRDISMLGVAIFVFLFLMLITLITGLFPAFYAWRFEPVSILNHKQELKGVGFLHKFLTIAQYSFSIAVLVSGFYFSRNSEFLQNMDYGYDNQDLLSLTVNDHQEYIALKQEMESLPLTQYTFGTRHQIGARPDRTLIGIDTVNAEILQQLVGSGYLSLMNVRFLEGRDFIPGSESDVAKSVIVNKEFAQAYLEPGKWLNSVLRIDDQRYNVVGVVTGIINGEVYSDYLPESIIYRAVPEQDYKKLLVKVNSADREQSKQAISEIWAGLIDRPFNGRWQSDISYGDTIEDSDTMKILFLWLAVLGCILSVIGIMSLASLNVAKKTKEISIRKVLGANLRQLMMSVNRPFIRILGAALILGCGLGYYVTHMILSTIYKYHLEINLLDGLPFGVFIVMLALIMTTVAVIKPATASPTTGLRSE